MDTNIRDLRQIFRILGKNFWKHYEEAVRGQTLTRPADGSVPLTLSREAEVFSTILKPHTVVVLYHPRERFVADMYQAFMGTRALEWTQYRNLGSEVMIQRVENGPRMSRKLVATLDDIAVVCEQVKPEYVGSTNTSRIYLCHPEHPEERPLSEVQMSRRLHLEPQLIKEYQHDRDAAPQRELQEGRVNAMNGMFIPRR